jgi:hypothetical protein
LKDNEIHRIINDQHRLFKAIEVLDMHNENLGRDRSEEAARLFEMRITAGATDTANLQETDEETKQEIDFRKVRNDPRLGAMSTGMGLDDGSGSPARSAKRHHAAPAAAAALTNVMAQQPQQGVTSKLATDIFKTFINPIVQEQPELLKGMDPRKDMFTSFMEQCLTGTIPEAVALQVFETFTTRCLLVVEPLHKSPAEFNKVWGVLCTGLESYDETSPLFDALCVFCCRLGESMRGQDSALTHQLFLDVQLGSLTDIMADIAGKRESIAEVMMTFISKSSLAHISVLRALKERLKDLSMYCIILTYFIPPQVKTGLLDDNLLDLYVYYAMVALHNAQPKVRVAGIALAQQIASAGHANLIWPLIPDLAELASDSWWEVQAQLLILASTLLLAKKESDAETEGTDQSETLLMMINRVFTLSQSKNVLQVGLVQLAPLLDYYSSLQTNYMAILLGQPEKMRARLFADSPGQSPHRLAYVMGTSSRLYVETPINISMDVYGRLRSRPWPSLAIAKGLSAHLDAMGLVNLETVHADMLLYCVQDDPNFSWPKSGTEGQWVEVYKDLKTFLILALVDAELHAHASAILERFWLNALIGDKCLTGSSEMMLKAMGHLYGGLDRAKVDEAELITFFEKLRDAEAPWMGQWLRQVIEDFKSAKPADFARSRLGSLF